MTPHPPTSPQKRARFSGFAVPSDPSVERDGQRASDGPQMTRDELLVLLERAIHDRSISVAAIKLRLEELRRDEEADAGGSEFDELDDGSVTPLRAVG